MGDPRVDGFECILGIAVSIDLASPNVDSHLQLGAEAGRYLGFSHSRGQSVLCYRPVSYEVCLRLIVCRLIVEWLSILRCDDDNDAASMLRGAWPAATPPSIEADPLEIEGECSREGMAGRPFIRNIPGCRRRGESLFRADSSSVGGVTKQVLARVPRH